MEQFLSLPPDGSSHGPAIDHLIVLVHWLMVVLFVGWAIFYVYTLIRFRKKRNPAASYTGVKSHFSSYVEVGVLLVEVVLLVGFSIPLWSKRVDDFPSEKDALRIHVVAEQFAWNIHYPGPDGKFGRRDIKLIDSENPLGLDRSDPDAKDDITTINQLNLPVNKPVIIDLMTKDVIHSFSLPYFRVKHDAIPGEMIPLWFTPVKTTDEIREEMRHPFSITDAMKKVRTVTLPQAANMSLRKGMDMEDHVLMRDAVTAAGEALLSKGDQLSGENIDKLVDAGMNTVSARPMANLDNYVSMEEVTNASGEAIVARNDMLSEDAVTKLIEAGKKEISARKMSYIDPFVVMDTLKDNSGAQIAAKGDPLTEEIITNCAAAGIAQISLSPATPTEIACAQLCGLGHYRMRGYVTVQSPEDFKTWFDQQEEAINPSYSSNLSSSAMTGTQGTRQ